MRYWPDMPKAQKEDTQMRPPTEADPATLRRFADLAAELGFKSDQITDWQEFPGRPNAPTEHLWSGPNLVTSGKGVLIKKRCGKPITLEFEEDQQFLFVNHLHDGRQDHGKNVTSFFVRKSIYLAFFGKPSAAHDIGQTGDPPQSVGGSPRGSGIGESNYSVNDNTNQSQRSSEHAMENYNGLLTLYQQRGARSEPDTRSITTEEGGAERVEISIDVSMQGWLEDQERERLDIVEQERLNKNDWNKNDWNKNRWNKNGSSD
ncbi:hypothetical protein BKA61DRAFT_710266 [Leptodontidium sp. MPI-SDFR-AT-0119]|nr:hypothetical protein BKA61DRAFT_710266 [Leptodontidium sp. MPI-SDFR-AT-0119]